MRRRTAWRRSLLIAAILTVLLALIFLVGYLVSADSAPAPAPPPTVELVPVPGGVAGSSPQHGPRFTEDGRAWGFSHDELGAAIAATNLAPRVAGTDATVAADTLVEQCWGDIGDNLRRLRTALPAPDHPDDGSTTPRALLYRIISGDPAGDHVVVSMLADTQQARDRGGLARIDTTLRWSDGDWRLRVPLGTPSLQTDMSRYILLARTP
ncbi:MAG: hypothetical protein J0I49_34285 [Pseudonocardia sp.]|uniref:hypothetical protein n=1 Tax=Pseudonocardia sp. TaxID=60912 RepID=UPI000967C9DA|nr:hypothetical protein [Pseudonocardia sp.]MBN9103127.1 hypothetical protein [Pseudonocardia sp.]OJY41601.1 MAG: hypothetical protein BGP03_20610 [Pseudonocardia sp. 73-21]